MTLVSSLAFPGSKTLAGWWRQLANYQPRAFGVGYLFVHRLEAPVSLNKAKRIDPLFHLLLQALDRETANANSGGLDALARLEARLHLGRQVLYQVLRSLEAEELAHGDRAGRWRLTPKGSQALAHGEYPIETCERRVFHFLERMNVSGERSRPPHFVNLRGDTGQAWSVGESCPFDIDLLRRCIQQPAAWKGSFGFPPEIRQLVEAANSSRLEAAEAPEAWQKVIVDRPERYLAAWMLVADTGEHSCLLVFSARQDGWTLNSSEPLLRIGQNWHELFPGLVSEPDKESLQKAWLGWAHSRGLPDADAGACALSLAGHRLQVQAGQAVLDRLKKAKSDVFKGETWLLIGDGHMRTAVMLQVQ